MEEILKSYNVRFEKILWYVRILFCSDTVIVIYFFHTSLDIFSPCDLIFPTIPIFVDDDGVNGTDDDDCDDDGEDDGGDDGGDEGDDYDDDDIGQCTLLC